MNQIKTQTTAIATGCSFMLSAAALASFPSFDDLASGTLYTTGDSFTSDGIVDVNDLLILLSVVTR